jgi:hypothetical protein
LASDSCKYGIIRSFFLLNQSRSLSQIS